MGQLNIELDWVKKNSRLPKERKGLIELNNLDISISRQCELLGISRSGIYYQPRERREEENLKLMEEIDEVFTVFPYYGSLKITAEINRRWEKPINHKRIERLMKNMGIQAIFPKKNLSKRNCFHPIFPYLLNEVKIDKSNKVWGVDITYIRANGI